jgi:hypothetical protein
MLALGVGSIGVGLYRSHKQAGAAKDAAATQAASADKAINLQRQMWQQQQANMAPWLRTGGGAMGQMGALMGITPWGGPVGGPSVSGTQAPMSAAFASGMVSAMPRYPGAGTAIPPGGSAASPGVQLGSVGLGTTAPERPDVVANASTYPTTIADGGVQPAGVGQPTAGIETTGQGINERGSAISGALQGLNKVGGRVARGLGGLAAGVTSGSTSPTAPPQEEAGTSDPYAGMTVTDPGYGVPPAFTPQGYPLVPTGMEAWGTPFQAPTLNETNDPGYQFRMQQGQKAIERSASARGTLNTGGTMKAVARYGQDYASNEYDKVYGRALGEYQQAYNIFGNNQSNRWNRLASLSGMGQTAATNLGTWGGQYGANVGNLYTQQGNVLAAGQVGAANAWNAGTGNATNSAIDLYSLWRANRPQSSSYL